MTDTEIKNIASARKRFAASIIDTITMWLICGPIAWIALYHLGVEVFFRSVAFFTLPILLEAICFNVIHGTIGMYLLGMKVSDEKGAVPAASSKYVRFAFWHHIMRILLVPDIMSLLDRKRRTVANRLSETLVLQDKDNAPPVRVISAMVLSFMALPFVYMSVGQLYYVSEYKDYRLRNVSDSSAEEELYELDLEGLGKYTRIDKNDEAGLLKLQEKLADKFEQEEDQEQREDEYRRLVYRYKDYYQKLLFKSEAEQAHSKEFEKLASGAKKNIFSRDVVAINARIAEGEKYIQENIPEEFQVKMRFGVDVKPKRFKAEEIKQANIAEIDRLLTCDSCNVTEEIKRVLLKYKELKYDQDHYVWVPENLKRLKEKYNLK